MSHIITREMILNALKNVPDNESGGDMAGSGRISSIVIRGNSIGFAIEAGEGDKAAAEYLRKQCEAAVLEVAGVERVTAVLTAHNAAPTARDQKEQIKAIHKEQRVRTPPAPVPGVKHIVAVASGKGGVGKSTTAVNLAVALAAMGVKTGLLDADIYGPSVPQMMGLRGKPEIHEQKMVPLVAYGVQCMSMGLLVTEGAALAWRGSMVTKALTQLFRGVCWDNVEVLVVDMPPGTGDVHLSLAENFPVSGAIVVSTPQEVALIDARKAVDMFQKLGIPLFGFVENMSYFEDITTGSRSYIFGQGGVAQLAESLGLEVMGEVPLEIKTREGGDKGLPIAAIKGGGKASEIYQNLAKMLGTRLGGQNSAKKFWRRNQ